MSEKLLNVTEVAVIVGVSVPTINNWYRWKKSEPDNELVTLLPNYIQVGGRQTRYWKQSDVENLVKFKSELPIGRNGILGDVTQKYVKNKKGDK